MDIVAEKYCELFDFPKEEMQRILNIIGPEHFRGYMNAYLLSLANINEYQGECVHG